MQYQQLQPPHCNGTFSLSTHFPKCFFGENSNQLHGQMSHVIVILVWEAALIHRTIKKNIPALQIHLFLQASGSERAHHVSYGQHPHHGTSALCVWEKYL